MSGKLKPRVASGGASKVDKQNGNLFRHSLTHGLSKMRPVALTLSLALVAGLSSDTFAQCCGTPTVAYSPVVAAAPAPVVAQTTTYDGWYPGKYLANASRNLFGWGQTTTTYTANYAPYTAGYAPYTAGYAPYSVGYSTTPYTAGYAPTYATAYRPTYPASWGAVGYSPAVQTVSRPVVLSPVVEAAACSPCGGCGACDACSGGVGQTYYSAPSTGCSSCSGGSSYVMPSGGYESSVEPAPALAPGENPPATRTQRPEFDDTDSILDDKTPTDSASAGDYWKAPPLFAPPANRVTKNTHPAPVQMAVYSKPVESRRTSFDAAKPVVGKTHHLSADGWASAD